MLSSQLSLRCTSQQRGAAPAPCRHDCKGLQSAESSSAVTSYSYPARADPSYIRACRDECEGLLRHFFGPKGDQRLSLETFDHFLEQLHAELVRLEFAHYDHRGRVSPAAEQGATACTRSGSGLGGGWTAGGLAVMRLLVPQGLLYVFQAPGDGSKPAKMCWLPLLVACWQTFQATVPPVLVLQGYITGIDFARSLAGSVPTSQVDTYLDRADALPEKLANAQVMACATTLALCFAEFSEQQHLMMSQHLHIVCSEKPYTTKELGHCLLWP